MSLLQIKLSFIDPWREICSLYLTHSGEAGVSGGNHEWKGNAKECTCPSQDSNPAPSCCEATVSDPICCNNFSSHGKNETKTFLNRDGMALSFNMSTEVRTVSKSYVLFSVIHKLIGPKQFPGKKSCHIFGLIHHTVFMLRDGKG